MAPRVRLTADVAPEVKKQVRIAAIRSDSSVSDWVERAVVRELERVAAAGPSETGTIQSDDAIPLGSGIPIRKDGRKALLKAIVADRDGLYTPPAGSKPKGIENPIELRAGKSMSDTIIEERGER